MGYFNPADMVALLPALIFTVGAMAVLLSEVFLGKNPVRHYQPAITSLTCVGAGLGLDAHAGRALADDLQRHRGGGLVQRNGVDDGGPGAAHLDARRRELLAPAPRGARRVLRALALRGGGHEPAGALGRSPDDLREPGGDERGRVRAHGLPAPRGAPGGGGVQVLLARRVQLGGVPLRLGAAVRRVGEHAVARDRRTRPPAAGCFTGA